MVVVAEVKRMRAVVDVAQADAHVVQDIRRNGDGYADTEDGMGDGQRINVARAEEDEAGGQSPDHGQRRKDWIGQVGEREYAGRDEGSHSGLGNNAQKARKEVSLQE